MGDHELIRIVFTREDVESIAESCGVDYEIALERALSWGPHIEDAALERIIDQLWNVIESDNP